MTDKHEVVLTRPVLYVTVKFVPDCSFGQSLMAEILRVDKPNLEYALEQSARLIMSGKVIAFPTDTFYGLGADPFNLAAVTELFRIKGRSADRPVPLLVASLDQAADLVTNPPQLFFTLAKKFWPGPLTLVVPASRLIPLKVTANTGRVGVRWPRSSLAEALILAVGRPLTGTSANLSEHPACSTAAQVEEQIGDTLPLILDGGSTAGGNPSTVVQIQGDRARILRFGAISESELKEFLS